MIQIWDSMMLIERRALSRFMTVVAVATAGVIVGACGVRGPLELPPEQKAAATTAQADSGQGKAEGTAPKPHQGFLLDWLIR